MLIDWFTVGAEIVNFLVLVWLLKRYLYRPILAAIDAREKDIVSRRAAALADQEKARKEREDYQRQREALEQQHLALMNKAQEEAKAERTQLLQEATRDSENLRQTRRKELEEEVANYRNELIRLTRQEIIAIVRNALLDLASADLEHSLVDVFLRRMNELPAIKTTESPKPDGTPSASRLRSAFALSAPQRETMEKDIQEKFQTHDPIDFETASDMGLGLELIVHDQKVAWNIDSYLASFETRLAEFAGKKSATESVIP
jgi:F-type H+-transporting ATPase subunit b